MAAADRLLGGTGYEIRGVVEVGAGRGHELGFPTANVRAPGSCSRKTASIPRGALRRPRLPRARVDRHESAVRRERTAPWRPGYAIFS